MIDDAYNELSSVAKIAYKDIYLISNQVLSKNPFMNNFLHTYLTNAPATRISLLKAALKLIKYYASSVRDFIYYVLAFTVFFIFGRRFTNNAQANDLVLIDTFFLVDRINSTKKYSDPYFVGLEEVLKKETKHYAFLPVFYRSRNPLGLYTTFRLLKKINVPVLCEYQLLGFRDLLKIIGFIVMYPFHVIKFSHTLDCKDYSKSIIRSELLNTLDQVAFLNFSRYLQGKAIAKLRYRNIKVISWYENQVIDKNLYKGLRTCNEKVRVYGAQPFLYSKNILNITPDEEEATFGLIPDKIIVNGKWFIPSNTKLNYIVGPSFRYRKLFEMPFIDAKKNDLILVILPYSLDDTNNILRIIQGLCDSVRPVYIKAHPCINTRRLKKLLPRNSLLGEEDLYSLFSKTKIIISAESGAMIEGAALGIPSVSVSDHKQIDLNPLPEMGKGVIWEDVDNSEDLMLQIRRFENLLTNNHNEIRRLSQRYKELFFCEPTEDRIMRAFDLTN